MAVENQRVSGFISRAVGADHVDGVFIGNIDRRKPRMVFDFPDVDGPAVQGVAAFAETGVDEILSGLFLSAQGRISNQFTGERGLRGKALVNGGENVGDQRVVEEV